MVIGIAYAPDGKLIASSGWDNLIRLWDARTGKEVRQLKGHASPIYGVAFSPDGKVLVSNGQEKTIRVWEVATGKQLRELKGHDNPHSRFSFTPDGKYLVSGGENRECILWDYQTGKVVRRFQGHAHKVSAVHISKDGKTLASGSWDQTVRLWDIATGQEQRKFGPLDGHLSSVNFSPDGKTLAAGTYGATIYLFDLESGKELRQMRGHTGSTWPVVFAPEGKTLASGGSDGLIILWDPATGTKKHQLIGHSDGVARLAFSPDGKLLASASHDKTVRLWEVSTGREASISIRHAGAITGVALSPDSKLLATIGGDRSIRLWEAASGLGLDSLTAHMGPVSCIAFTPDGKQLVSSAGNDPLIVWDVVQRKELHRLKANWQPITALALSPDGKKAAAVGGNKLLRWNLGAGESVQASDCPRGSSDRIAWSPDGRTIAVAGAAVGVDLWDVPAGRWLKPVETVRDLARGLTFSGDGRLLLVHWHNGSVSLLETATGEERLQRGFHATPALGPLPLLPGGRFLKIGTAGLLRLGELRTGRLLREKPGLEQGISSITASADGRLLVTGLNNGTALVWDISDLLTVKSEPTRISPPGPPDAVWQCLAGTDAVKAHETIASLVAHPEAALELLRPRLKTESPPDSQKIARLIVQLEDRRYPRREEATRELARMGTAAETLLKKALDGNPSLDARRRIESILAGLGLLVLTAEQVRGVRAVEGLEQIGNSEARRLLEQLAAGPPDLRVTQEAKASLGRLGQRP
jgi:WD40 repeat protein